MPPSYNSRMQRLLGMQIEIKTRPGQTVLELIANLGVGRSQFYGLGFIFHYDRSRSRFVIDQEKYLPVEDLSLSERLILILAARHLSDTGDYTLCHHGLEAAKKLLGGLEGPLREAVASLFDDLIVKEGFGCDSAVIDSLNQAISESRRVRITYKKPSASETEVHEVDPYRMVFRKRALYLEGYSATRREIRTYRVSRIREARPTAMSFQRRDEYDLAARSRSIFSVFSGKPPQKTAVRFSRKARPYIEETLWHHSQQLSQTDDGGVVLTMEVAEPKEVLWWAFEWGAEAEILEPEWLRQFAMEEIRRMMAKYGDV